MEGMKVLVLMAVLVGSSAWTPPAFCRKLDCPVYETQRNITLHGTNVEIRKYPAGQFWAWTEMKGERVVLVENVGYQILYDYIVGDNAAHKKIPMAAPVLLYVVPGPGSFGRTTVSTFFYLPYQYQPEITSNAQPPPQARRFNVHVQEQKNLTVAVLSFGGFPTNKLIREKASELVGLLQQSGLSYDPLNWYYAGYDRVFVLEHRHNEIWVEIFNDMEKK